MRSKALPFLSQVRRSGLTQGPQYLGLCQWLREKFPGALALQRALRLALLTRDPQQAAPRLAKVAFQLIIGPREVRHIIAVEQPRPMTAADLVQVQAKS